MHNQRLIAMISPLILLSFITFSANNNPTMYQGMVDNSLESEEQKSDPQRLLRAQIAYELDPHNCQKIVELARAHNHASDFDMASQFFNKAVQLKPNDFMILLELGNNYNICCQYELALQTYFRILKILPDDVAILYNIAYTLKKMGKIQESMPYYQKVLELDPEYVEAHFSLAIAYLLNGDFQNGWREYEWRWKRSSHDNRKFSKPQWDGSDLHGKTILLHAEQGLGDTFQFIRYARVAKERGAHVLVAVQKPAMSVLKLCPYIDKVLCLTDSVPAQFDFHAPLMSMPYIVKTQIDTVPNQIPYLYADQKLVKEWHSKLAPNRNFKVGICWQGNANYHTHFLRSVVAAKSLHLKSFLPFFNMPGVTFYNLQKECGEEQLLEVNHPNLISFDSSFDSTNGRFMDTAAVIKNLDLVLTVDTGTAHLAAALGARVWVMMPEPSDWRWMLNCNDTPWYPNMRLFRQPKPGDWQSVINEVSIELTKLLIVHALK